MGIIFIKLQNRTSSSEGKTSKAQVGGPSSSLADAIAHYQCIRQTAYVAHQTIHF